MNLKQNSAPRAINHKQYAAIEQAQYLATKLQKKYAHKIRTLFDQDKTQKQIARELHSHYSHVSANVRRVAVSLALKELVDPSERAAAAAKHWTANLPGHVLTSRERLRGTLERNARYGSPLRKGAFRWKEEEDCLLQHYMQQEENFHTTGKHRGKPNYEIIHRKLWDVLRNFRHPLSACRRRVHDLRRRS